MEKLNHTLVNDVQEQERPTRHQYSSSRLMEYEMESPATTVPNNIMSLSSPKEEVTTETATTAIPMNRRLCSPYEATTLQPPSCDHPHRNTVDGKQQPHYQQQQQHYIPPTAAISSGGGHQTSARGNDNNNSVHSPPALQNLDDPNQPIANIPIHAMSNHQEEEEKEDYNYDDEEIQRDAANEIVALVVHIAIGLFMILFFGALIVSILIVSKYGFFTFLLIMLLMTVALTIGYFVSKIMDRDHVLRPVRRKIRRWHAVATAVVIQEIQDFHLDWNEHLLLMNGSSSAGHDEDEDDDDPIYERMEDEHGGRWHATGPSGKRARRRGAGGQHRSKVFGFLVKPFLKEKNGKRFRFRRKKKSQEGKDDVGGVSVEMT